MHYSRCFITLFQEHFIMSEIVFLFPGTNSLLQCGLWLHQYPPLPEINANAFNFLLVNEDILIRIKIHNRIRGRLDITFDCPITLFGNPFWRCVGDKRFSSMKNQEKAFPLTFNASRRPFPNKLKASTNNMIAKPGARANMGFCVIIKL